MIPFLKGVTVADEYNALADLHTVAKALYSNYYSRQIVCFCSLSAGCR
jgi:hypothetical protein